MVGTNRRKYAASYVFGIHTPTRRCLKCPSCGKRSFCKFRIK